MTTGEDFDDPVDEYRQATRTPKPWPEFTRPTPAQYLPAGQWACTCGDWHHDGESCSKGGTQIMATGSEDWDL